MLIPGFLLTALTFPGVIVHELAHQFFCELTGTRVIRVCYFRFGNPAGYVVHERPASAWRHLLIGIGPLIVNTSVGLGLGLLAPALRADSPLAAYATLWLAVSIAMHSFPSTTDAKGIWGAVWSRDGSVGAKLVGTPVVLLIFLGAFGSLFWLDLAYGVGVVIGLPRLLPLS